MRLRDYIEGQLRTLQNRSVQIPLRPVAEWTVLGVAGLALVTGVFVRSGRPAGPGIAISFAVAWLTLPAVYRYAVGHVLALGVAPNRLSALEFGLLELGFAFVLLSPLSRLSTRNRQQIARSMFLSGTILFAVVIAGLSLFDQTIITGALLLGATSAMLYVFRRIGQGTLDLLPSQSTRSESE